MTMNVKKTQKDPRTMRCDAQNKGSLWSRLKKASPRGGKDMIGRQRERRRLAFDVKRERTAERRKL